MKLTQEQIDVLTFRPPPRNEKLSPSRFTHWYNYNVGGLTALWIAGFGILGHHPIYAIPCNLLLFWAHSEYKKCRKLCDQPVPFDPD